MTSFSVDLKMCMALIAAVVLSAPAVAQDRLASDLARYEQETDVVRKARALVKLGDDQIDEARKQLKAGDDVGSLHTLDRYRDEIQHMTEALKATGVDAERKPGAPLALCLTV